MNEIKRTKTFKREIAAIMLVWLMYLVETKDPEVLNIVTLPIFTFAALAFGMQWYSPNGKLLQPLPPFASDRGRSKRSGEHPSGEDK